MEATHEASQGTLKGAVSAVKKPFKGLKRRRGSCWEEWKKIAFPGQGFIDLLYRQINDRFFKVQTGKIELVARHGFQKRIFIVGSHLTEFLTAEFSRGAAGDGVRTSLGLRLSGVAPVPPGPPAPAPGPMERLRPVARTLFICKHQTTATLH